MRSKRSWGGVASALEFARDNLARQERPWCLLESENPGVELYAPALPWEFRKAMAERKLLWVKAHEASAPWATQAVLESGLCGGVVLLGVENFARFSPASLWAKRWQLAARKGGAHFLWVHEKLHSVTGFEACLEWTGPATFEIKRGYGLVERKGSDGLVVRGPRFTQQPAA